jgi:hypothetical protein
MDMNKEIGYWLRKEFATEWGGHCVSEWTMTDIADYTAKKVAKYGEWVLDPSEESSLLRYTEEGATHVIRCLNGSWSDLVDGVDLYIQIDGSEFHLVSEIDSPDYQGGEYKDAQVWLRIIGEPIDA